MAGIKRDAPPDDQRIELQGVSWHTYEGLLRANESWCNAILTSYRDETLVLRAAAPPHLQIAERLGRIVSLIAHGFGMSYLSVGRMILKRETIGCAREPDAAFYLANEPRVRGRMIDLAIDPPPDLAIEVDLGQHDFGMLAIYRALGVPEVWHFDGKRLRVLVLGDGGDYQEAAASRALPLLYLDALPRWLEWATTRGERAMTQAVVEWVRHVMSLGPQAGANHRNRHQSGQFPARSRLQGRRDAGGGVAAPVTRDTTAHEQQIVLRGVSWPTYEGLLRANESPGGAVRLSYQRGVLVLHRRSEEHVQAARRLGLIVRQSAAGMGLKCLDLGRVALQRESQARGREPDAAFYLGSAPRFCGRTIDLDVDPPPDLAIEVEITAGDPELLSFYAVLGVPEVWHFDGKKLRAFQLGPGKAYREVAASPALPLLPLDEVPRRLERAERDAGSVMSLAFLDWVRSELTLPAGSA